MNASEIVVAYLVENRRYLIEMNVINQDALNAFLKGYIDRVQNPAGKQWFARVPRKFFLNFAGFPGDDVQRHWNKQVDPKTLGDPEGLPEYVKNAIKYNEPIFQFQPNEHLGDVMTKIVSYFDSEEIMARGNKPDATPFTDMIAKADAMLKKQARLAAKQGQVAPEQQLKAINLDELGVKKVAEFEHGFYLVLLTATPEEKAAIKNKTIQASSGERKKKVSPSNTDGDKYGSMFRSLRDESYIMSQAQGTHVYCIGNGTYDNYILKGGASGAKEGGNYSLRDKSNVPWAGFEVTSTKSIRQLHGRMNAPPLQQHIPYLRKYIVDGGFAMENGHEGLGLVRDQENHVHPVEKLPPNANIRGSVNLVGWKEFALPEGLTINGDLNLEKTPITELPARLHVTGKLNIEGTQVTRLPPDLFADTLAYGPPLGMEEIKNYAYNKAKDEMVKNFRREQAEGGKTPEEVETLLPGMLNRLHHFFMTDQTIEDELKTLYPSSADRA